MRISLTLVLVSLCGSVKAGVEVVDNDGAIAEVCDEDEPFSEATCMKYKDIIYESDNNNPKPQWIMEPIPTMKRMLLRRMRKGGSTSLEKFIQKARQVHQRFALSPAETMAMKAQHEPTGFIGYDAMEYESLNMQCLFGSSAILGPESQAILVTHFRYPIDRINSEYWYRLIFIHFHIIYSITQH